MFHRNTERNGCFIAKKNAIVSRSVRRNSLWTSEPIECNGDRHGRWMNTSDLVFVGTSLRPRRIGLLTIRCPYFLLFSIELFAVFDETGETFSTQCAWMDFVPRRLVQRLAFLHVVLEMHVRDSFVQLELLARDVAVLDGWIHICHANSQ